MSVVPAANYFAIFIFYIIWKAHFLKSQREDEENSDYIKPEKFVIEISGLNQRFRN